MAGESSLRWRIPMEEPTLESTSSQDADIPQQPADNGILTDTQTQPEIPESETSEETDVTNSDDITETEESITLDDLANYTGIETDRFDLSEDGEAVYLSKVDGKTESVPLKTVFDNYQRVQHLNKENRDVVELKKNLTAQVSENREKTEAKIQMADDLMRLAYEDLQNDVKAEDWDTLYQDDQAVYAAKKVKYAERQANLESRYKQLTDERINNQPDITNGRAEMATKLKEVIPGWDSDETAQKEYKQVVEYALSEGFDNSDLNNITDHRLINLLRKSMLFDRIQSEKTEITKKVRKSPKLRKSGSPATDKKEAPKSAGELFYGT